MKIGGGSPMVICRCHKADRWLCRCQEGCKQAEPSKSQSESCADKWVALQRKELMNRCLRESGIEEELQKRGWDDGGRLMCLWVGCFLKDDLLPCPQCGKWLQKRNRIWATL